jgi:hypothetical protein
VEVGTTWYDDKTMEYFYSGGGNSDPYFSNRIKVNNLTNEMWQWCTDYKLTGHFARWHCEYGHNNKKDYDIVQFEREEPALMFALKFGAL